MIQEYMNSSSSQSSSSSSSVSTDKPFVVLDDLSPIVSTRDNFDSICIPPDHPSRSKSMTYYLDTHTVLRCHTSAHQHTLLKAGYDRFLVVGDVYRRDDVDKSHYPVFHQLEGVKIFRPSDYGPSETFQTMNDAERMRYIEQDLKTVLEGLAKHLFGPDIEWRWVDEYFPFTNPSLELEIYYDNQWMEVLGCGVIHPQVLQNAGRTGEQGWAFGLGLERLAMILFQIPDIRLFWSQDQRFHEQFTSGQIITFQPYSKFPPCYKDMSFWLPDDPSGFHLNELNEVIRDVAGDLVEQLQLIDQFTHPKSGRVSHCYRITYRSMDRNLTNEEIDALQEQVREQTTHRLGVELR
jgi:phenylalanyl-tRNA synthetase alpha chain